MSELQKVSFTIRRPTPVSRASSGTVSRAESRAASSGPASRRESPGSDSSEDEQLQDELITGFDKLGAQRLKPSKKQPQGPLVIPALKNRDWRELARKRRTVNQYVPASAAAETGKDGSVGGLGTKDTINAGPVLSGLQVKKAVKKEEHNGDAVMNEVATDECVELKMETEETEDQKALRAVLASASGINNDGPDIDSIPIVPPVSEADAYKQDMKDLPDVATLEDYARVPVSQFGAALLRGMGWKEGTAASRKPGKGLVEPYLPEARPALLGIGAKEREVFDDGQPKKGNKRPEKRYVPVVRKERETNGSASRERSRERERRDERSGTPRSGNVSRRNSRSPGRHPGRHREYDDRWRDGGRRDYSRGYDDGRIDRERDGDRRRDHSADSSRKRRDY